MIPPEFNRWLSLHLENFPSVGSWLAKFPREARHDFETTQKQVVEGWRRTLADVALDDAIAATNALANGDEAFSERAGFDHHARDVRRIARRAAGERTAESKSRRLTRRFDGEPTFACPRCQDQGLVKIIHPASVAAAGRIQGDGEERFVALRHPRLNPRGNVPLYAAVAACECEAGSRYRGFCAPARACDPEWRLMDSEGNFKAAIEAAEAQRAASVESRLFDPDEWLADANAKEF